MSDSDTNPQFIVAEEDSGLRLDVFLAEAIDEGGGQIPGFEKYGRDSTLELRQGSKTTRQTTGGTRTGIGSSCRAIMNSNEKSRYRYGYYAVPQVGT